MKGLSRLVLLFSAAVIVVSSYTAVLHPGVAAAADNPSAGSCRGFYETRGGGSLGAAATTAVENACIDGFENGTGDGNTCIKYRDQPGGARQEAACREGWNRYERARQSCDDSYTIRAGGRVDRDEDKIQACYKELRPGNSSSNSSSAANAAPTPNPGQRPVGPFPTDFTVASLKAVNDKGDQVKSEAHDCGIQGFFGSIMCGITTFIASLTDKCFYVLEFFLKTEPVRQTSQSGGASAMYTAWSVLRSLANVFFIFAFLAIILSYVTNYGLDNYNIKKMIPRLIAGVVLINLSFWISAAFVDVSNILGKLLADIGDILPALNNTDTQQYGTWTSVAGSIVLIGGAAAVAGAAVMYGLFSALLPSLVSAFIAIITTFLMLMIRQVLIILFIIVSPLAFAAILLPNTSSWYEKWQNYFITILMLYPAVSFIFGISQVASKIIRDVGLQQDSVLLTIASLVIQIAPLFLLPSIMKLGGNVLSRWTNIGGSKFSKGLRSGAEKYAKHRREVADSRALLSTSTPGKYNPRYSAVRRRYDKKKRSHDIEENLHTAQKQDFFNQANDPEKGASILEEYAQASDRESLRKARNKLIKAKASAYAEAIKIQQGADVVNNKARQDKLDAAKNSDGAVSELVQDAALLSIAQSGDIGAILDVMKNSSNLSIQQRRRFIQAAAQSGAVGGAPFLANSEIQDSYIKGNVNEDNFGESVIAKSLDQDDYSVDSTSKLDQDVAKDFAEYIDKAKNNPNLDARSRSNIQGMISNAKKALDRDHPEAASQVSKNYASLDKIAGFENHNWGSGT